MKGSWLLGTLLVTSSAVAEPGFWDRVREPRVADRYWLWKRAERSRHAVEPFDESPELEALRNQRSALMIAMAAGPELSDPHLLYLYGECLVKAGGAHYAEGRRVLERALAVDPASPNQAMAWDLIAEASVALGDYEMVERATEQALTTEWHPGKRGHLLVRRAMAHMRQEELPKAIADFRAAVSEQPGAPMLALARWGLAVALDRSYDLPSALPLARTAHAARFGPAGIQSALELPWVQFKPKYEVYYYRALAQLAEAEERKGEPGYVGALQTAQLLWVSYTRDADPDSPWLPRAREHVVRIHRQLSQLIAEDE